MEQKQEFTMREVVDAVNISEHTVRQWISLFNLQIETTQGGHRRFSRENIDQLLLAKQKKEEQGWSMKQIAAYFSGDVSTEMFESDRNLKTNLEKKLDEQNEKIELLIQANKNLAEKLDVQSQVYTDSLHHALNNQKEEILNAVNQKLENATEKRDRQLMLELRKTQEEITAANTDIATTAEKKPWWKVW